MVFKRDKNGAATGPVSHYDSTHVLRLKFDVKEGIDCGMWRYYYPSGRSWAEVAVRNDRLHGAARSYHPNGIIHATNLTSWVSCMGKHTSGFAGCSGERYPYRIVAGGLSAHRTYLREW